jgi:hypothetical protein
MAIAAWRPARDGATWAEINAAWEVLHTLIMAASKLDAKERS